MTTPQPLVVAAGPDLPEPGQRVGDQVAHRAHLHPDHPAVICGDRSLSYRELTSAARKVAERLAADPHGARSRRIGVWAARTEATVAHLLGVSLAGRSFVPLDPGAPADAVAHIRASAGLTVTTDPATGELHRHGEPDPVTATPAPPASLADEAYVLYTSGSTGRPKGVTVSQYNLAASNQARLAVYEPFGTPVFLLLSPFHFDSSMAGLWGTLAAGGTVVVAQEDERRDPAALLRLIDRHGVTHLLTVPGFYAEVLGCWSADPGATEALASLRTVVCAGEALARSVIDGHFRLLPGVPLGNEYGPTECTVWSTYRFYREPARSTIGFPVPGSSLHLLDDGLRPVAAGEVGQIAVSGRQVAGGYVGDPQRTEARFVVLDDGSTAPVRAYLTGDLGRWTAQDGLEFVGRLDNEVKIRGVRITLEAIEEVLTGHPDVQAACAAYDGSTSTCYAFVVAAPGRTPDPAAIRRAAEAALGAAAVPDRVVLTDSLPRTAHDKVDRAALLASAVRPERPAAEAAGDGLADRITRAWEDILDVGVVSGAQANFFELGGNSLTVLRLTRALGRIAGRRIAVKDVYRAGTIAEQVALLAGSAAG
ncbi:non-ribosomal peptide synthetase [Streptomyces sp. NPDC059740]|uniref:non-ribosomal peptide synthetase n=1 Tax=Streptomyces sp. NPDC059740 TaxID=3346926 RepID=UPI00364C02E1